MKLVTFKYLKNLLEAEENFEEVAVSSIIENLKLFKNIKFSKKIETEDYITIVVNSENPLKARSELTSYKFSHATNLIFETIKRSGGDGLRIAVYDEDGDPFDKDIYIQIRKGGEYNAGVKNELNFANMVQNAKSKTIRFKDKTGKELVLKNVESIRDCSKDPGSRTGNKADVEIITDGKPFRVSLKKNNAYKVAGLIKKFARESYKIGKLVRQYYIKNDIPFERLPYISIPITNMELYRWCVFGNDMQQNGALIQGDFSKEDIVEEIDKPIINVDKIITPDKNDSTLMQEFPIYFLLSINKHGSVETTAAVFGAFGRRYLKNDLVIPGVNDNRNIIESNEEKPKSSSGIFYGYNIYADYDEQTNIFHTRYKIKDYGLKGMAYINILSITDDEIKFRDLKWNEETENYEPAEYVSTVHIEYKEPCNSRKRKSGFGMEEI